MKGFGPPLLYGIQFFHSLELLFGRIVTSNDVSTLMDHHVIIGQIQPGESALPIQCTGGTVDMVNAYKQMKMHQRGHMDRTNTIYCTFTDDEFEHNTLNVMLALLNVILDRRDEQRKSNIIPTVAIQIPRSCRPKTYLCPVVTCPHPRFKWDLLLVKSLLLASTHSTSSSNQRMEDIMDGIVIGVILNMVVIQARGDKEDWYWFIRNTPRPSCHSQQVDDTQAVSSKVRVRCPPDEPQSKKRREAGEELPVWIPRMKETSDTVTIEDVATPWYTQIMNYQFTKKPEFAEISHLRRTLEAVIVKFDKKVPDIRKKINTLDVSHHIPNVNYPCIYRKVQKKKVKTVTFQYGHVNDNAITEAICSGSRNPLPFKTRAFDPFVRPLLCAHG